MDGGIGFRNKIPWYVPSELKKFRDITMTTSDSKYKNAVIMGRNTFRSLKRPLRNRINIVLTTDKSFSADDCIVANSLQEALKYCEGTEEIESVYIIGGAMLYNECIRNYNFDIYLSVMFCEFIMTDTSIDIWSIFEKYTLDKDPRYVNECLKRRFASYICKRKKQYITET